MRLHCPKNKEINRLKSRNGRRSGLAVNSAFETKTHVIRDGTLSYHLFTAYDRPSGRVTGRFAVSAHFIARSVVRQWNQWDPNVRRSRWVGLSILLPRLAGKARGVFIGDLAKFRYGGRRPSS